MSKSLPQRAPRGRKPRKFNPQRHTVSVNEIVTEPNGQREQLTGRLLDRLIPPKTTQGRKRKPKTLKPVKKQPAPPPDPPPPPRPPPKYTAAYISSAAVQLENIRLGDPEEGAPKMDVPVVDAYDAGLAYATAVAMPFTALPARIIEPCATMPTEAFKFPNTRLNLTIYNGTTAADGSTGVLLRGDTLSTVCAPSTVSALHAVTWTGGLTYSTYAPYTNAYYHRHLVTAASVEVYTTGPDHTVSVSWYNVLPGPVANQLAAGPSHFNIGCPPTDAIANCGSDGVLHAGETAKFISMLPPNFSSYTYWQQVTTDRGSNGTMGWFLWLYGLNSTDRVTLTYTSIFEVLPRVAGTSPLDYHAIAVADSTGATSDMAHKTQQIIGHSTIDAEIVESHKKSKAEQTLDVVEGVWKRVGGWDGVWRTTAKIWQFTRIARKLFFVQTADGPQPVVLGPNWFGRQTPQAVEDQKDEELSDFQRVPEQPPRQLATPRSSSVSSRAGSSSSRLT